MENLIKVLIVDDNKYLADLMGYALAMHEDIYITGICNSGAAALDALQNAQADVMLLDIIMPDMDGLQVLAHMNDHVLNKPAVILLTAIGNDDILQTAAELGADSFLLKPVNADVIVQRIRTVYESRRQGLIKADV